VTGKEDGCRLNQPLAERIDPAARSRLKVREVEGILLIEAALPGPFRAFFTTRLGGESLGRFASLNLSPFSEDDPSVVARNRARLEAPDKSTASGSRGQPSTYSKTRTRHVMA
jgi:hypothetical protein